MLTTVEKVLRSRGIMSLTAVFVIMALVFGLYQIFGDSDRETQSYCVELPDAVGLYQNNTVTMRGVAVGKVTELENTGNGVRAKFTVDGRYPLRGSVSATTLSESLVANRNLAIINGETGAPNLPADECITSSLTPKSLTETLAALQQLSIEISTDPTRPDDPAPLQAGIAAVDGATAGLGPQVNEIITRLGTALASPDVAIGRIGTILQALSSLSHSIANGWSDIESMLTRFSTALDQANNELLNQAVDVVDQLRIIVPWINSITRQFGGPILTLIDSSVPLLHAVASQAGTITDILNRAPVLASALTANADSSTGDLRIGYSAPALEVSTPDSFALCAAANLLIADSCTPAAGGEHAQVNLAVMLTNAVGGEPR